MTVFNSLGSNYNLNFVFRALFASNNQIYKEKLGVFLAQKYVGQVVLIYKGREALRLALRASNVKGATVAICGYTCFAVYDAIVKEGYGVEYLDIEKNTLHFTYDTFKKSVENNPKIKVVIIQNTLGYPCEIESIARFCKENKIILIEDLAHSIGSVYPNKQEAGTVGDFTVLSFSQDKVIDGISGGALIVRNQAFSVQNVEQAFSNVPTKKQFIDRLYPLFTFKIRMTYGFFGIGKLYHALLKKFQLLSNPMSDSGEIHRLPAWYCSLIYTEFLNLEKNLAHRRAIAALYLEKFQNKALISVIDRPIPTSSNVRFPLMLNNRESLISYLKKKKIFVSDIWYDSPIAPKQFLSQTNYTNQCPRADSIATLMLNLPTHKNVSEKKAQKIIAEINQWLTLQ